MLESKDCILYSCFKTFIIYLILLHLSIFIHETAHFLTAKLFGYKVSKIVIGSQRPPTEVGGLPEGQGQRKR